MCGVFDCIFLSCQVHVSEWIHTLKLPECQGTSFFKQAQYLKFKSLQWARTHNHLVHKQNLNHLAKLTKWLSCVVSSYMYDAFETCMWHDKNIQSNAPYRQVLTMQFNHLTNLAKWLSVHLRMKWLWVRVTLQSLTCSEQGAPWHLHNYGVWIHPETHTWHDKNIQWNAPYR